VATSNVEAHLRYGVPVSGTMDHFAVQAWEQPGRPRHETEEAFFRAFHAMYPGKDALLVDTYDTFGEHTGLAAAVRATDGKGPFAVRIDSNLTRENVWKARRRLDDLGARDTKIYVSGGVEESKIAELGDAPIDAFGIGENLVVSSDAPVGVGAVGKLTMIRGVPTTKLSRGSAKAHLPGIVQVWRKDGRDVVGLVDERRDAEPLLSLVWDGLVRSPAPPWAVVRERAQQPAPVSIAVSDALAELFTRVVGGT
jgi:nicotinate phosphoribosyltransferase